MRFYFSELLKNLSFLTLKGSDCKKQRKLETPAVKAYIRLTSPAFLFVDILMPV